MFPHNYNEYRLSPIWYHMVSSSLIPPLFWVSRFFSILRHTTIQDPRRHWMQLWTMPPPGHRREGRGSAVGHALWNGLLEIQPTKLWVWEEKPKNQEWEQKFLTWLKHAKIDHVGSIWVAFSPQNKMMRPMAKAAMAQRLTPTWSISHERSEFLGSALEDQIHLHTWANWKVIRLFFFGRKPADDFTIFTARPMFVIPPATVETPWKRRIQHFLRILPHEGDSTCMCLTLDAHMKINPALQPNSRLFLVPRLQCHHPRFQSFGFQDSTVAAFQGKVADDLGVPRVPRFQSRLSRLLDYQWLPFFSRSKFPGFSRFQASRFQTCKGLGLIHQQRSDQRNAKQKKNTIELFQLIFQEHNVGSLVYSFTRWKVPSS